MATNEQPNIIWDPAGLLGITDAYTTEVVQCIGVAPSKNNARCGWKKEGENADPIMTQLRNMAANSPRNVTRDDLRHLAQISVCKLHDKQVARIVQEWAPLVQRAASIHEAHVRERNTLNNTILLQQAELKACYDLIGVRDKHVSEWVSLTDLQKNGLLDSWARDSPESPQRNPDNACAARDQAKRLMRQMEDELENPRTDNAALVQRNQELMAEVEELRSRRSGLRGVLSHRTRN
ncbi:hypothetical protein VTJ49DRAFT_2499 [Mycothermus thermophilus]|uniref:Uncharacterized protein n=1 Tax=Humicola insolens TaxID=85995 RepID=A0ABR3V9W8_HUMIN